MLFPFKEKLPKKQPYAFPRKVVIESLVERKSWGDIAVDDIKVLNGLSMTDCKGEGFKSSVQFLHSVLVLK